MKESRAQKELRMLDYIKGFLFKLENLTFKEVSAAHDVAEYINKECTKVEKRLTKKGKFDSMTEMKVALQHGISTKDEWDKANGHETREEEEARMAALAPMHSSTMPSESEIEAKIKEMEGEA